MFVSLNQLSHELNLPSAWLRAEARAGRIPSLRVGRRLVFDPERVMRVLSDRARGADANGGLRPRRSRQALPNSRAGTEGVIAVEATSSKDADAPQ